MITTYPQRGKNHRKPHKSSQAQILFLIKNPNIRATPKKNIRKYLHAINSKCDTGSRVPEHI